MNILLLQLMLEVSFESRVYSKKQKAKLDGRTVPWDLLFLFTAKVEKKKSRSLFVAPNIVKRPYFV